MYTLWNVISLQRNETEIQFVLFYSLNFVKPVHVHLMPQYTPDDVEHSAIPSGLLLMEYHLMECSKFNERWISRYQSHNNNASMTSLGIVQKPAWLHHHSRKQRNLSFFLIDLSTSCTVLSISNISRILVIVTLVGDRVPNSTLQRRCTSRTFYTFQQHFSDHLSSSKGNFTAKFV